ncbi:glycosyltransferase [Arthrobacter agilis]|uniref:glycosyltransferase n=1 Tax=Arthrobacter agilis TaxID=37921 RepID=UPI0023670A4B|nr:glycosyltransferase [Arthrobacter agilis]WDF32142.1 glycosyltransferase [Arthrobacter agilis]
MTLIRNTVLAGTTGLRLLGDDPVLLVSQVARRLPSSLARRIGRIMGSAPGSVVRALGAHLAGDPAERARVTADALRSGVRGRAAAGLAEIALLSNDPAGADHLLRRAGTAARTRARRFWYDGSMTEAIEEQRKSRGRSRARRLESELRVYQGWAPTLPSPLAYIPVANTVLHVLTNSLPHTGSGYAQRSHSLLMAQSALGWDVHAATRLGYPVQIGNVSAGLREEVDGVTYHRLLPRWLPIGFDTRLQLQAELLLKLALEVRPAVLHTTTDFTNGIVTREVARVLGIPWVYEVRGQLADTWASVRGDAARNSEKYQLFQAREKDIMTDADLLVTLGAAMKSNITAAGIPDGKVLLLPNAVGGEFLDEPLTQAEARRIVGLPPDGQYIGTVSSLVPYEGLNYLIDAFVLLAGKYPDLTLLFVGDGVSEPSLRAQAESSPFAERILFVGRVPRRLAVRYHQALDLFVVPRLDLDVTRSVTPLKPVEALAASRPVVASDLPALREIVEQGTTGILTEPESAESLAAGLDLLLASPGRAEAFGRAGRLRVLSERTWAANAAALTEELERLGDTDG